MPVVASLPVTSGFKKILFRRPDAESRRNIAYRLWLVKTLICDTMAAVPQHASEINA
jgi:hypothetical protein